MGLEHISVNSACQDRRIRVGGGADDGDGVRAGVGVLRLLAVGMVYGRAGWCAWCPAARRTAAAMRLKMVSASGSLRGPEHDPVAGGEPG